LVINFIVVTAERFINRVCFPTSMEDEKPKQTLRQKWLPTLSDSEEVVGDEFDDVLWYMVKKYTRTLFCAGAILWGSYQGIGNNVEYSQGMRTGMINKISEKGLFWKTYEGQMALEGIVSGNNSVGANVWDFSFDRQARHGENPKELAEKIRQYLESGTKVKVTYVEPLATWPWRSGTDYLIQSVEPVAKAEKQ